jgi:hypothetical protein
MHFLKIDHLYIQLSHQHQKVRLLQLKWMYPFDFLEQD